MKNYSTINISDLRIEDTIGNVCLNIEPGCFCVFDSKRPSNGIHAHNCYELCIVTEGGGELIQDKQNYKITKGDVFITDPQVFHEIRIKNKKADMLCLFYFLINIYNNNLQPSLQAEETILNNFLCNHEILCSSTEYLNTYLDFMAAYCMYKTPKKLGINHSVKSIVLDSLLALSASGKVYDSKLSDNSIIDLALYFINMNADKKIRISEVARHVNTSVRNLQHLFRKYMSCTIIDYVNTRKMGLASSYLKMNFKVTEISSRVGISDPAQLSRLFKKYYGISPKKYQMLYSPNGMVYGASVKK